jgi:hypothetical protein
MGEGGIVCIADVSRKINHLLLLSAEGGAHGRYKQKRHGSKPSDGTLVIIIISNSQKGY